MKVTFREEDHTYWRGGRQLPSVTQILDYVGLIDKTWYNDDAMMRGTAVHHACALLANDILDWSSVCEEFMPYVIAFKKFLEESGCKVLFVEQIADGIIYAGTYDLIVELKDGSRMLIDIKTGTAPKWVGLQTAGYSTKVHDIPGLKRGYLELKNNSSYKLVALDDIEDILNWEKVLAFYFVKKALTA